MKRAVVLLALACLFLMPAIAMAQYDYPSGGGGDSGPSMGNPPAMNPPSGSGSSTGGITVMGPSMTMPGDSGDSDSVNIVDFAFQPGSLAVPVGTTLRWHNSGAAPHTVTANTGAFDSGTIAPGGNFSETLSAPGLYMYHCNIHPNMTGTVMVTGS